MSSWFVYILSCRDGSFYTGITTDLERRLREHNDEKVGAKYTKARRPVKLVYSEDAADRSAASRREWELKQLTKKEKKSIIDNLV